MALVVVVVVAVSIGCCIYGLLEWGVCNEWEGISWFLWGGISFKLVI